MQLHNVGEHCYVKITDFSCHACTHWLRTTLAKDKPVWVINVDHVDGEPQEFSKINVPKVREQNVSFAKGIL